MIDRSPVGHWQLGQHRQHREPAVVVDPHMSYLATIVPVGYLRDDDEEEPGTMLQFPDPPLYSDVSGSGFFSIVLKISVLIVIYNIFILIFYFS